MNFLKFGSIVLLLQLLLLPAVLLGLSALLFFLTVPITVFHFPLALLLTVGICYWIIKKNKSFKPDSEFTRRDFIRVTGIFVGVIIISILLGLITHRAPSGEASYQEEMVMKLDRGWNPYREPMKSAAQYPNASRIAAASVYKITGSLAAGKIFPFLFILAVFLVTINFFLPFNTIPLKSRFLIAALVACNPVSVYQLTGFHCDGQAASLITILIVLAFQYIIYREPRTHTFLFITLLTLSNMKFSGFIYALFVIAASWLTVFIMDRNLQARFLRVISIAFLLAVFVLGFHPYVTNTLHTGNPFNPSFQGDQGMERFEGNNRFVKLFYSLFSRSEGRADKMPVLKVPFTLHEDEIAAFQYPDVRYGGFGPFFGSIFLLSLGTLLLLGHTDRLVVIFALVTVGIIFISALLSPAAWWARHAPQLWLLPISLMVTFYYTPQYEHIHYLRGFILSALLINCLIVFRCFG